jgi:hypothetical protein
LQDHLRLGSPRVQSFIDLGTRFERSKSAAGNNFRTIHEVDDLLMKVGRWLYGKTAATFIPLGKRRANEACGAIIAA